MPFDLRFEFLHFYAPFDKYFKDKSRLFHVEHFLLRTGHMISSVALVCIVLTGCRKPNPTPETEDGVYLDLRAEQGAAEKAVAEQASKIEGLKKDLEKANLSPAEKKATLRQLNTQTMSLVRLKQYFDYLSLRVESRKAYSADRYATFYHDGKETEWVDKTELDRYKAQKRLANASRKWSDRVPRPKFVGSGDQLKPKKEKAPAQEHE